MAPANSLAVPIVFGTAAVVAVLVYLLTRKPVSPTRKNSPRQVEADPELPLPQDPQPSPVGPLAAAAMPVEKPRSTVAERNSSQEAPTAGTMKKKSMRGKAAGRPAGDNAAMAAVVLHALHETRAAQPAAAAAGGAPAPPASASSPAPEPSAGEPFAVSVLGRGLLAKPSELLAMASPAPKARDGGSKKRSRPVVSSWAESFIHVMRILEAAADASGDEAHAAAQQAQKELTQVLRAARNPGSPPHALSLTLRGLGYVFASIGLLPQAEAAYARALSEARAKGGEGSAMALSCWRDVAVMAHEQRKYAEAEVHWRAALACQAAGGREGRKAGVAKGGHVGVAKGGHAGVAKGGHAGVAKGGHEPGSGPGGGGGQGVLGQGGGEHGGRLQGLPGPESSETGMELQLCVADTLRLQLRHAEAEPLVRAVLAFRQRVHGADHPLTLGAVYDLSHLLRAQSLHRAGVPAVVPQAGGEGRQGEGKRAGGGQAAPGSATASVGGAGWRAERSARVREALAAAVAETSDLDAIWFGGLQALCKGEPPVRLAEQLYALSSAAQAHGEHAEALLLLGRAMPVFESAHGGAAVDASRDPSRDASRDPSRDTSSDASRDASSDTSRNMSMDMAEMLNSQGESQVELRLFEEARDSFDRALAAVTAYTGGVHDASVASIQANQARLLSLTGDTQAAASLFATALATVRGCVGDAAPAPAAADADRILSHVILARVLKLFAEFEAEYGDAEAGREKSREVAHLEAQLGFNTQ